MLLRDLRRRSGAPPRLSRKGKLELTEAPWSKTRAERIPEGFRSAVPEGSIREARERTASRTSPAHYFIAVGIAWGSGFSSTRLAPVPWAPSGWIRESPTGNTRR